MLLDEYAAKMCDLADSSLNIDAMVAALLRWSRAGKASARQTLKAATIALKQKQREIDELARAYDELVNDNDELEEKINELRDRLKDLLATLDDMEMQADHLAGRQPAPSQPQT
jgi:chromosome segregation ATPase